MALAAVCFFWGTTYLAIRMALESFPPMLLVCARYLLSGVQAATGRKDLALAGYRRILADDPGNEEVSIQVSTLLADMGEVRLSLDPAVECPPILAPLVDPNLHSCGTVRPHGARELAQPEPGFYFAGMKSYGRAPTFLMLTGYEQVRSIVAEIAGDKEAAAKVELVLPATGVCSGPGPSLGPTLNEADAAAGCCGGPAPEPASGCCVADVKAKEEGKKGCGC